MLEIKKIVKTYKTEGFEQKALNDVSVNFRKNEFACILGPSGSGKTTFLNIIGGLDHYDSGNLIINGVSTKNFNDRDWDSYRNHRVGFVFQNYNLITHQTVLSNVELALTLSGISKAERRKRAFKALKDVGLEKHVNKKPNQLSGGQMQRVAIARALVNDPEIVLADEPTGALDSETSIQIMKILKQISNNKLVIMVTHNPDLAEEYSNRIINIKDGKVISDSNPFDGIIDKKSECIDNNMKSKKTKMSFFTALSLSFNNLMTKKWRTILVAIAGSIGIIGIALILAVSTGFQNYIDSIQESALTSYPLTIMQESSDITGMLLSMREKTDENIGKGKVKEQQYITSMLGNVKANDLKSFKKHLESNNNNIKNYVSNIQYLYSVAPNIYTIDATNSLSKVNPSNLFTSMLGSNSILNSYSQMTSIFSQMVDNTENLEKNYDVLSGRWPKEYNELILVLSEKSSISDLLVYSLGLRDTKELTTMVTKIMSGETVDIKNEPKIFTYDELLATDLRLIIPSDMYKYNSKYDIYEDMSNHEDYMNNLYKNAVKLKIVGIVCPKQGVTSSSLNPGVAYVSSLTDYIINESSKSQIVKQQILKSDIDIFSGNRFDSKKNNFDFKFSDLVKVDEEKLKTAFDIKIDKNELERKISNYMNDISKSINIDVTSAKDKFNSNLNDFSNNIFKNVGEEISLNNVEAVVDKYLNTSEINKVLSSMEKEYVIPKETFKTVYSGLLKALLQSYIFGYSTFIKSINPEYVIDQENPVALIDEEFKNKTINSYINSAPILSTVEKMSNGMVEARVKKEVLTKVGELTAVISNSFANAFNVDQDKIVSAFQLNFSEDELARVVSAMMNNTESTQKSNLIALGYQDKEEPTFISIYFNSFDGKEEFLSFIDKYNENVSEEKQINYSDTAGILMSSVKTIVNAVSYVLIAFVSISLVVSSIMIGVITYISVYERTKEIGVLRAIGASKHNISSIFNAETFIIGFLSGLFGIGISYGFIPIINKVIHHFTGDIPLSAILAMKSALLLVLLAITLTIIGGLIPSKMASKKDPVEALRSE